MLYYDQNQDAKFFDSDWMFNVKDGFDVVIGNPPYISFGLRGVGKLSRKEMELTKELYPNSAEYKVSIYAIFMELAIKLCDDRSFISYIVPDSFLLGRFFSKIRSYILSECIINYLLLIKDKIFDNATVGKSTIFLLQKNSSNNKLDTKIAHGTEKYFLGERTFFSYNQSYFLSIPRTRFRMLFDAKTKYIIDQIEERFAGHKLRNFIKFQSGLIAKNGQDKIKSSMQIDNQWRKGIFSGSSVLRYVVHYEEEYLCYSPQKIKSGGINTVNYFEKKLFVRQTGDSIICALDNDGLLALNNVHIGNIINGSDISLNYIAACLNSRLVDFYYKSLSLEEGRTLAQIDIDVLADIPIPPSTSEQRHKLDSLVDNILDAKAKNPAADTTDLERDIDEKVYKLYGLTSKEDIAFIEASLKKDKNKANRN